MYPHERALFPSPQRIWSIQLSYRVRIKHDIKGFAVHLPIVATRLQGLVVWKQMNLRKYRLDSLFT